MELSARKDFPVLIQNVAGTDNPYASVANGRQNLDRRTIHPFGNQGGENDVRIYDGVYHAVVSACRRSHRSLREASISASISSIVHSWSICSAMSALADMKAFQNESPHPRCESSPEDTGSGAADVFWDKRKRTNRATMSRCVSSSLSISFSSAAYGIRHLTFLTGCATPPQKTPYILPQHPVSVKAGTRTRCFQIPRENCRLSRETEIWYNVTHRAKQKT